MTGRVVYHLLSGSILAPPHKFSAAFVEKHQFICGGPGFSVSLREWMNYRQEVQSGKDATEWKQGIDIFRFAAPLNQFEDKEIRFRFGEKCPVQIVTELVYRPSDDQFLHDRRISPELVDQYEAVIDFELPPGVTRELGRYDHDTLKSGCCLGRLTWNAGKYRLSVRSDSLDAISGFYVKLIDGKISLIKR